MGNLEENMFYSIMLIVLASIAHGATDIRRAISQNIVTPLKRVVLLVFSCYSGSWINNINSDRSSEKTAQEIWEEFSRSSSRGIYEQLIVLTSSSPNELSYFTPGGGSH